MAFPTDWGRRCSVVIQSSKVSSNLSDYPVLLTEDTLPSEMFDADGSYPALNGGGDIRFTSDSAGTTQLPLEVVAFVTDNDPANGTAQLWVKVPTVSSSSDTTIYVWYNKSGETQPAVDSTYGAENVWDSNFKGVWHLTESSGTRSDSTSNDNDLSDNGTVGTETGPFGQNAANFNGSTQYLSIADASQTGLDGMTDLTVQAWVNLDVGTLGYVLTKYGSVDAEKAYQMYHGNTGTVASLTLDLKDSSENLSRGSLPTGLSQDTWGFSAAGYDNSTGFVMRTNSSATTGTDTDASGVKNSTGPFQIGASDSTVNLNGGVSEARVSDVQRSADWLEADYNNQSSPSTFAVEGTPETPGDEPTATPFAQAIII